MISSNIDTTNIELMRMIRESHAHGQMTQEFAQTLIAIVDRYANKPNFKQFSYTHDMQNHALSVLNRVWSTFKYQEFDNPFAFIVTATKGAFVNWLAAENIDVRVRDELLERYETGLLPRFYELTDQAETL